MNGFIIGTFSFMSRTKAYNKISMVSIFQSLSGGMFKIFFGITGIGYFGIAYGYIGGILVAVVYLIYYLYQNYRCYFHKIRSSHIKFVFLRYIDFFKFNTIGAFLNTLSSNIFYIFVSLLYGLSIVGFYDLVFKLLSLPLMFIGNSIRIVYYQKSVESKKKHGNNKDIFLKTLLLLVFISIIIFLPLGVFLHDLIELIFGLIWLPSADIGLILLPSMVLGFISISLQPTMNVYEKQKGVLYIGLILIGISLISFLFAKYLILELEIFLYIFSVLTSIIYIIFLTYFYKLSKGVCNEK